MAVDDRGNRTGRAATDPPARASKWLWILGGVFLVIAALLLLRGVFYAGSEPRYDVEGAAITDADRTASGVESDAARTGGNGQ